MTREHKCCHMASRAIQPGLAHRVSNKNIWREELLVQVASSDLGERSGMGETSSTSGHDLQKVERNGSTTRLVRKPSLLHFEQAPMKSGECKFLGVSLSKLLINESSFIAAGCPRYRDAAFGPTLIGNRVVKHGTDPLIGQEIEENIDYPLRYWHFRQFLYKVCPNGVVNGAGNPQLQYILGQYMKSHAMFEKDYVAISQGRRFFTSLDGYIGISPPNMRPDDSICVFLGGNVL